MFSKICEDIRSTRWTTGVKIFNQKNCHYSSGHMWVADLTQIHFSFKFILSCQQPDTVSIVCHRCRRWQIWLRCCWYWWQAATGVRSCHWWQISAGIIDTGGKFATDINNTSETDSKICCRCCWYGGAPWLANISVNFQKNLKQS